MKFNKWTLGLAAVGVVSLISPARADETPKPSMMQTALSNTTISGYIDVSAQFNPSGGGGIPAYEYSDVRPGGGYGAQAAAPNYYYGNNANGFNFNVVDIAIDKPQDESPWAAGYHVEFFVGPVAQAMGLNNDIRQAYLALRTPVGNGIDWKVGIFDTIVGYESTTSGNNPNYSHSFGYNMEPTTHTGILATYKAFDWLTMQAGIADTSYAGAGAYTAAPNTGLYLPTLMWGPTLTAPDSFGWAKGATLQFATIITSGNTGQATGANYNTGNGTGAKTFYAGITLPTPIAALKVGGSFDYLNAKDISANEWAAAGYATYQFNDKLSLNLRAEYLNGGGNTALGTPLNSGAFIDPYGVNGQAQEITATVQYAIWANVLTRLEVRWDHCNHANTAPYDVGYINDTLGTQQANAWMLAAQAIYTF